MAAPSPVIALSVGGFITWKTRTLTVALIETTKAHGLAVGDTVTIANESAPFNGSGLVVTSVPTPLSYTFTIATGTNARAAGAGTGTTSPTGVALQQSRPSLRVDAVESGSNGTVNPGGRVWRNNTTAAGVVDTPATLVVRRAGTILVNCNVTNTDPLTAASGNTTITSTDALAVAAAANIVGSVIPPPLLPLEYRDPTMATPGIPDAAALDAAQTLGTVLPTASQRLALSGV